MLVSVKSKWLKKLAEVREYLMGSLGLQEYLVLVLTKGLIYLSYLVHRALLYHQALTNPIYKQQKNALKQLPLTSTTAKPGEIDLFGPSSTPEPIQAGLSQGPGIGSEGVIAGPENTSNSQAYQESLKFYPLMMRLQQTGQVSTQTKAFLRRMRANAPLKPYEMPQIPTEEL